MELACNECSITKRLESVDLGKIDKLPFRGKVCPCRIIKVIDGDTIKVAAFYADRLYEYNIRIINIDAPEMKSKNDLERRAAIKVTNYVMELLKDIHYFIIYKNDKYGGRYVGDIYLNHDRKPLSRHLLRRKLVKEFTGKQKKEPWTETELLHIVKNF